MCGSPGLANLSPPPEVRKPTDCREREPRASGPSRRHPRQRGLLLEEMWLGVRGGGWSPTGENLTGASAEGPSPAPSGQGTRSRACAGLGLALPQTRG